MESGIEEYWIIDPKTKSGMVYFFKEGELDDDAFYTSGQRAESIRFPELTVSLDKLFWLQSYCSYYLDEQNPVYIMFI